MHGLFSLSPLVLLILFALLGAVSFMVGLLFLWVFHKQASGDPLTMPIGAFIGTIATAWALSLGFAAADIWAVNSQAGQASSEERSSISRLVGMAKEDALDSKELMAGLKAYKNAVIAIEWGTGANTVPTPEVEKALQSIRIAIIDLARGSIPAPLIAQMVQDFDELQDARNTRLALGATSINYYKWYLVIFLTALTLVVISAVHADRPPAGRKSLIIFTVTATVSLWILAIHANPYVGVGRVSMKSFEALLPS